MVSCILGVKKLAPNFLFIYIYIMNGLTLSDIKKSGLKKQHIAAQIGVSASYFSRVLKGEKGLKPEKEKLLKDLLKSVA